MNHLEHKEFTHSCHKLSDKILSILDALSLAENSTGNLLIKLQERIFTPLITPFIDTLFRGTNAEPEVGLVSHLELVAEWNKDWGNVVYAFYVGSENKWDEHLSQIVDKKYDKPWNDKCNKASCLTDRRKRRNKSLFEQTASIKRAFAQDNLTAKILSQERLMNGATGSLTRGEIAGRPSEYGISVDDPNNINKDFRNRYPWALALKSDFPMIYFGIFEFDKPLGFFQMKIRWLKKAPIYDEIPFNTCYKKDNDIVETILIKISILADIVLRQILVFLNQQIAFIKNKDKLDTIYDKAFIGTTCANKVIQGNKFEIFLKEFREYFDKGYCNADELALKTICSMWDENILLKDKNELSDLKKAEANLFWSAKYREHLIHSVKVFILGNYFMQLLARVPEIKKIFSKNSFGLSESSRFEKFQELWMLTATFHDFCVPIEYLAESQKNQYVKFIGSSGSPNSELDKDFTADFEKKQFLSKLIIKEQIIYPLFHILHYHYPAAGKINYLKNLKSGGEYIFKIFEKDYQNKFKGLTNYGILHFDIFEHFLTEGDHGISSAIRLLKECFPYEGGKIITEKEIDDIKKIKRIKPARLKNIGNMIFKSYFQVIYAIFIHNFIEKKQKSDKEKPIYEGSICLSENPLAFLLLLCDTLQDWGREESFYRQVPYKNGLKISSRPIGNIITDRVSFDNRILIIPIDYFWIITKNDIPVSTKQIGNRGKCRGDNDIKEYCKKECEKKGDACNAMSTSGDCKYEIEFRKKFHNFELKFNNDLSELLNVSITYKEKEICHI
ncbi:hypothetical protein C4544_04665 [candidate division WS5 bacterium]|uniref:Uncharacterized protein n=1 Tax=candidate division WS5 bacterium TaxID=2093353 RepID=A0A419DC11_9BACT|nr:MAG: hypothetical protein C4544_04665 [candidate division WS5 bacterium]